MFVLQQKKNVSKFYIPVTLFIGSLLLFYFELAMFNLVGNYAFFYLISATFLLSSSVTSFIFEFKYKKAQIMSSKEIITDEMRSFIGLESDPVTYVVEKHSIEHFARAIGESNPIYFDEQFAKDNVGGIIAPPTFIRLFRPKRLEKQFPDSFSNLVDGGSSYTFHEKIFVGDQITVVSKLKDLFIKSGSFGDMMFKDFTNILYKSKKYTRCRTKITTILYGKGEKTFLS